MTAGLVFKYGDFEHDPGEVYPQMIEIRPRVSDRGQRWATHVRYQLAGEFLKDPATPMTSEEVTTRIDALKAAYADDFKDFGFYLDDGTTPTSHVITNDFPSNLSGNRVLGIQFPHVLPNEYANTQSFRLSLGALFKDSETQLLYFKETVSQRGTGGPHWTYRSRYRGRPVREEVQEFTPVRLVQRGVIIGLDLDPVPPAPWWPADEHEPSRIIERDSGRQHGHQSYTRTTHQILRYRYEFERELPPGQSPNIWIP